MYNQKMSELQDLIKTKYNSIDELKTHFTFDNQWKQAEEVLQEFNLKI